MIFKCHIAKRELILSMVILSVVLLFILLITLISGFYLILLLPLLLFISIFLFVPLRVDILPDKLIVRRILLSKSIPFSEILAIKERTEPWKDDIRIFGSMGFGGYIGWFRNDELGKYSSYVTDIKSAFWVVTANGVYLLSCKNHKKAVEIISERVL